MREEKREEDNEKNAIEIRFDATIIVSSREKHIELSSHDETTPTKEREKEKQIETERTQRGSSCNLLALYVCISTAVTCDEHDSAAIIMGPHVSSRYKCNGYLNATRSETEQIYTKRSHAFAASVASMKMLMKIIIIRIIV